MSNKDNDAIFKELDKLEYLFDNSGVAGAGKPAVKAKAPSIPTSLDDLLASLHNAKQQLLNGERPKDVGSQVLKTIENKKKDIDERQKEVYNSLGRIGKALDKKFPESIPKYPPLFFSSSASTALDRVVALHFIRTGSFDVAETFIEEAHVDTAPNSMDQFIDMHRILNALRSLDFEPALQWCCWNRDFLRLRAAPLEFHLHRSRYLRLLVASGDAGPALSYARRYFPTLYSTYSSDIARLTNATLFLPVERLIKSPYADFLDPSLHSELEIEFASEYCAMLNMSRQLPLRAVSDIGGGGALMRIEKGKKVMQDKRSEWSSSEELPIEIAVPPENRYHSIFACPVSKEQATETNPPMMLTCGHVLAKDSLTRLLKAAGNRVKCPYCPVESPASEALRVFF